LEDCRQTEVSACGPRKNVVGRNVTLKWTPEDDADGVLLFTAIQEQLGLKLEPVKVPMDVVVIDHIEQPSEN
jgi:uncharacterized protein (TIGR03435 family)